MLNKMAVSLMLLTGLLAVAAHPVKADPPCPPANTAYVYANPVYVAGEHSGDHRRDGDRHERERHEHERHDRR
jgi:hypothetical protein